MSSIFGGGTTQTKQTTNVQQGTQSANSGDTQQSQNGSTTQNNNTTGNTAQSTGPSQLALPYITQALQYANGIFGNQQNPSYTGETYAGLNPSQLSAITGLNNFATGQGTSDANALTGAGTGSVGNLVQGGAIANAIAQKALSDPTAQNITDASAYANNPYTQQMITAANTPIEQQLNENALTGNHITAAGTGNTDSSRTAITDAILRRDAGTQEANNAGTILGNQYNSGLQLAQNANANGLLSGVMAANGLTSNGTAGASAIGAGYNTGVNNANIPLQTGNILQQNQQGQDTANLNQYELNQQLPWQLLAPYYSMLTSGALGQTGVGTSNTVQAGNQQTNAQGQSNFRQSSNGQSQGTSNSTGTITQPGPGILGGLLGAATGIGSLFTSGGLFGSGGALGSLFGNGVYGTGGGTGGL